MKVKIYLKDPDAVGDAITEAVDKELNKLDLLDEDEREILRDGKMEKIQDGIKKWVEYREYVTVEIDLIAGTARVCEVSE